MTITLFWLGIVLIASVLFGLWATNHPSVRYKYWHCLLATLPVLIAGIILATKQGEISLLLVLGISALCLMMILIISRSDIIPAVNWNYDVVYVTALESAACTFLFIIVMAIQFLGQYKIVPK